MIINSRSAIKKATGIAIFLHQLQQGTSVVNYDGPTSGFDIYAVFERDGLILDKKGLGASAFAELTNDLLKKQIAEIKAYRKYWKKYIPALEFINGKDIVDLLRFGHPDQSWIGCDVDVFSAHMFDNIIREVERDEFVKYLALILKFQADFRALTKSLSI